MLMTWTTGMLLLAVIGIALYAFGIFNTPYTGSFRFAFYLLLAMLALTLWFGVIQPPNEGYDPTVGAR